MKSKRPIVSTLPQDKQYVFNSGSIERHIKRILVTGGAGFLGSHLIDMLMSHPLNEVICVDNLFSGSKKNILKWLGNPRFEFIRHDVCDPILLEVDQIYHLACPASPVFYQNNGIKTIKTSVLGTLNMCGLAKRVGATLLIASTSEVYGDPPASQHPQKEEYWGNVNPIGIRSCYDEGKRIAEALVMEYFRQNNVDIRIARIFNTYGPRMLENDGRVVSNFIVQALRGEPLTVYGPGHQTRSFCYCTDLIQGLYKLMNQNETVGPINLGNPNEFKIIELADLVVKCVKDIDTDVKPHINHMDMPSDDPRQRQPDITKAKHYLKWEPTIQLSQGLKATVMYFKELLESRKSVN